MSDILTLQTYLTDFSFISSKWIFMTIYIYTFCILWEIADKLLLRWVDTSYSVPTWLKLIIYSQISLHEGRLEYLLQKHLARKLDWKLCYRISVPWEFLFLFSSLQNFCFLGIESFVIEFLFPRKPSFTCPHQLCIRLTIDILLYFL